MTRIAIAKTEVIGPETVDAGRPIIQTAGAGALVEEARIGEHVSGAGKTIAVVTSNQNPFRRTRKNWRASLSAPKEVLHSGDQPDQLSPESVTEHRRKRTGAGTDTYDIDQDNLSTRKVGTRELAETVIGSLGQQPSLQKAVSSNQPTLDFLPKHQRKPGKTKNLLAVDLIVHCRGGGSEHGAEQIQILNTGTLRLAMIINRKGMAQEPEASRVTSCADYWRCRFVSVDESPVTRRDIIQLLERACQRDIYVIKTENLYALGGQPAFSLGQI